MNVFRLVLTVLFHSLRALGQSRADLVLENVALRQQIAVLTRTRRLPRLQAEERLLWVALRRTWSRWQDALLLVQPETVVAWHRKAFRRYWTILSQAPGRPRLDTEVRRLIVRMACENPTWGAPRLHGGPCRGTCRGSGRAGECSESGGRFLRNHREVLAAMDFFTVPTAAEKSSTSILPSIRRRSG